MRRGFLSPNLVPKVVTWMLVSPKTTDTSTRILLEAISVPDSSRTITPSLLHSLSVVYLGFADVELKRKMDILF